MDGTSATTNARLKSFVERIERLDEEQRALGADKRDVYAEAKSAGFDPKIIRKVVQLRRMDEADRNEQDELIDLYMRELGM